MYLMRQNCFKLVSTIKLIFVLHNQLLVKNAHRSWIYGIQKNSLTVHKKIKRMFYYSKNCQKVLLTPSTRTR